MLLIRPLLFYVLCCNNHELYRDKIPDLYSLFGHGYLIMWVFLDFKASIFACMAPLYTKKYRKVISESFVNTTPCVEYLRAFLVFLTSMNLNFSSFSFVLTLWTRLMTGGVVTVVVEFIFVEFWASWRFLRRQLSDGAEPNVGRRAMLSLACRLKPSTYKYRERCTLW